MDTNIYLKDQLGNDPNQLTGLNVSTCQFSIHVEVNPNEFTLKKGHGEGFFNVSY